MFGVFSGPITDGTNWVSQYYGSIRLDGQFRNSTYTPNVTGTYLNHMDVGLNVTADGHAHVASNLLTGTSSSYTQDGWNVLNGTFNAANKNFDWQIPYVHVQPALLASGRIDASGLDWSPDGTTGYLLGTAIDADLAYNPYGIEWPVVYKSADQGVTWNKIPAFDFSTIGITWEKLYPTRSNLSLVIPRWYNKWVGGESNNGTTVDIKGNLHIFSLLRSTLSTNADSLNYFYTLEPNQLFDVFMAPGGGWNAIYIDTLMSTVVAAPGTYGIGWDHQMQMTRTPDGSKVFCVWTDTNPGLWGNSITDNSLPDLKAIGYDVVNNVYTNVKNFTELGLYWAENYWMRVGDKVVVNAGTYTLPVTTSIPGATNNDPLIHQYFQGIDFTDADFINVGIPTVKANTSYDLVSQNYPNPCKGLSRVTVNLKEASRLHLVVNDLMGRNVFELPAFNAQPGAQMLVIDASKLSPGVYTYTVSVNHVDITKKMIVK